jgi:DNA-directed RNA polymerase specialized sigma24 family protein
MTGPERGAGDKADRALELHDKGLKPAEIAERLGVYPRNVGGMLQRARERRTRLAGEVVE